MSTQAVVTTINRPTAGVKKLSTLIPVIVIGDNKTPDNWSLPRTRFYGTSDHSKMGFDLAFLLPHNHYARKNLGYLAAIREGATIVYDTDDDNIPLDSWRVRDPSCDCDVYRTSKIDEWCNAYRFFHGSNIWPRGFPLERVAGPASKVRMPREHQYSLIQQGLADDDPDVDAVWRMVGGEKEVKFSTARSVSLARGAWCPFNSQSTWWFPQAYPLMYLPTHATFRMTDIWRSFVAQRCLWELGSRVAFHAPSEVYQIRNPHNLLSDFKDEIPGYLNNAKIAEILERLKLQYSDMSARSVCANMRRCYSALVLSKILPRAELVTLDAWIRDIKSISK